jgi:hypothetical protein
LPLVQPDLDASAEAEPPDAPAAVGPTPDAPADEGGRRGTEKTTIQPERDHPASARAESAGSPETSSPPPERPAVQVQTETLPEPGGETLPLLQPDLDAHPAPEPPAVELPDALPPETAGQSQLEAESRPIVQPDLEPQPAPESASRRPEIAPGVFADASGPEKLVEAFPPALGALVVRPQVAGQPLPDTGTLPVVQPDLEGQPAPDTPKGEDAQQQLIQSVRTRGATQGEIQTDRAETVRARQATGVYRSMATSSLPLAPLPRPLPATISGDKTKVVQPAALADSGVIQTFPEPPLSTSVPAGDGDISGPVIQRDVDDATVTSDIDEDDEAGAELDLDKVARQVYPLIKRMMAIERDRLFSR